MNIATINVLGYDSCLKTTHHSLTFSVCNIIALYSWVQAMLQHRQLSRRSNLPYYVSRVVLAIVHASWCQLKWLWFNTIISCELKCQFPGRDSPTDNLHTQHMQSLSISCKGVGASPHQLLDQLINQFISYPKNLPAASKTSLMVSRLSVGLDGSSSLRLCEYSRVSYFVITVHGEGARSGLSSSCNN